MRIEKDPIKERENIRQHKLDFSFAEFISRDPLALTIYDRHESGEHRWHTFSNVGGSLLLAVHTYPDPDDDECIRITGLRKATSYERTRYEQGGRE